jgi:Queuine tRNA-ribosyltransferase
MRPAHHLTTRKGTLTLPIYLPTVDQIHRDWQPYLIGMSPALVIPAPVIPSFTLPLQQTITFVSSGASLIHPDSLTWSTTKGLTTVCGQYGEEGRAVELKLTPAVLLADQLKVADIAFTLEVPIYATDSADVIAQKVNRSVRNALWTLRQEPDLILFAALPYCPSDWLEPAIEEIATHPFDGVAIGVNRALNALEMEDLLATVRAVREWKQCSDLLIHISGVGEPEQCQTLYQAGVTSTDSTDYCTLARTGRSFGMSITLEVPSPYEQNHLALQNLAMGQRAAQFSSLPLSLQPEATSWFIDRTHSKPQSLDGK